MTVYVDDMIASFGRMKMSHMIADTEAELHTMADAIGVQRRWYQGDHYDIAQSKRAKAVELGAVPITMRELSVMHFQRDRDPNGKLITPEQAREVMKLRREQVRRRLEENGCLVATSQPDELPALTGV